MDPTKARAVKFSAQRRLREMVNREVSLLIRGRGPQNQVEDFVRAIYSPDKRLAP